MLVSFDTFFNLYHHFSIRPIVRNTLYSLQKRSYFPYKLLVTIYHLQFNYLTLYYIFLRCNILHIVYRLLQNLGKFSIELLHVND